MIDDSRPKTLEQRLLDAFEKWSWYDRSDHEVIRTLKAKEVALQAFGQWLEDVAQDRQGHADRAPDQTARTVMLVRVDTIQQLVLEAAPDAD